MTDVAPCGVPELCTETPTCGDRLAEVVAPDSRRVDDELVVCLKSDADSCQTIRFVKVASRWALFP